MLASRMCRRADCRAGGTAAGSASAADAAKAAAIANAAFRVLMRIRFMVLLEFACEGQKFGTGHAGHARDIEEAAIPVQSGGFEGIVELVGGVSHFQRHGPPGTGIVPLQTA